MKKGPPPSLTDRYLAWHFRRRWRGFYTLLRCLKGSQQLAVQSRYGQTFELYPHHYIDGYVIREGFYESEVFEALVEALNPGDVFWDIGANFGLHAVSIKALNPNVSVFAFEPVPSLSERLSRNASRNRVELTVLNVALSDTSGISELYTTSSEDSGRATLTPHRQETFSHSRETVCSTAKDLMTTENLPSPQVIKIDVEGAEHLVLQGFEEYLYDTALRAVVFEGSIGDQAFVLIQEAGFTITALERNEETDHPLQNFIGRRE